MLGGWAARKAVNTNAPSQRQAPTPKRAAVKLLGCFAAHSAHHSVPAALQLMSCYHRGCSMTYAGTFDSMTRAVALEATRQKFLTKAFCCNIASRFTSEYLLLHSDHFISCQLHYYTLSCLSLPPFRRFKTALDRFAIFPPMHVKASLLTSKHG